jgi:hypothetical protein
MKSRKPQSRLLLWQDERAARVQIPFRCAVPAVKVLAVSLALLLAACVTPPETATPAPAEPEAPRVERPVAPVSTVPRVARAAPPAETRPPGAAVPVEPSTPTTSSFREFVAANDEHLLEVYTGLGRAELVRVMQHGAGRWPNPYRREALLDRDGRHYEVFYYLTRDPEGKPVKDRHLVPVIVQDHVVVAIGSYRLKKLKRGEPLDLPRRSTKRAS